MAGKQFTIGRLAGETGCKVQTIRYYEEIGIMPQAARSNGNQRVYGGDAIKRLGFIRHGRELGFSLDAIRELLELAEQPDRTCAQADAIASNHLGDIDSRIARLEALRDELKRMVGACRGGPLAQCRILEVLQDHSLCVHDEH